MRILIGIRHQLLRDGIRRFLSELTHDLDIFQASTFDSAMSLAVNAGGIDLALLSCAMPGMDGLGSIPLFRRNFATAKLILLLDSPDSAPVLAAIAAGADGVISKTISGQAMLHSIRLVMSGECCVPSETVFAMARKATSPEATGEVSAQSPTAHISFSPGEAQTAPLLAEGLSNKVIALRLGIKEAAVKARLRSIFKKMGVANRAQAVKALMTRDRHPE